MGIHAVVAKFWIVVPLTQGSLSDLYEDHGIGFVDKGVWCLVG